MQAIRSMEMDGVVPFIPGVETRTTVGRPVGGK
jgi:hypothetical protein